MGEVVSLSVVRDRREAAEHARALLLHECATRLARDEHPELLGLIERTFGAGWLEERVREAALPRKR